PIVSGPACRHREIAGFSRTRKTLRFYPPYCNRVILSSALRHGVDPMKTLILAGGSGTRLFPLSREHYPKQFIPLVDDESLFQKTVKRSLLFSSPQEIAIVTNTDHRFLVRDQLAAIGCDC